MRPEEIEPTPEQQAYIDGRGYRAFKITHDDGTEQLIFVYRDSHLAHVARRPDRYSSWSAPIYFQEIWE